MADPDIQIPNTDQGPSHLVVEQGLFARTAEAPGQGGIPSETQPVQEYENEETAETPAEHGGGSILMLLKENLFWVLLIPMVIIEIILLIMVISQ